MIPAFLSLIVYSTRSLPVPAATELHVGGFEAYPIHNPFATAHSSNKAGVLPRAIPIMNEAEWWPYWKKYSQDKKADNFVAADSNSLISHQLGEFYFQQGLRLMAGDGVMHNPEAAFLLFKRAADVGNIDAMYATAMAYKQKSMKLDAEYYQVMAWNARPASIKQTTGKSQIEAPKLISETKKGPNQEFWAQFIQKNKNSNFLITVRSLSPKYQLGEVYAQQGIRYFQGDGKHYNPKLAFELFQRAAEVGSSKGVYAMALAYDENAGMEGVVANEVMAAKYYKQLLSMPDFKTFVGRGGV